MESFPKRKRRPLGVIEMHTALYDKVSPERVLEAYNRSNWADKGGELFELLKSLDKRTRLVYVVALGELKILDLVVNSWFVMDYFKTFDRYDGIDMLMEYGSLNLHFADLKDRVMKDPKDLPKELISDIWTPLNPAKGISMLTYCLIHSDFRRAEILVKCGATYPLYPTNLDILDDIGIIGFHPIVLHGRGYTTSNTMNPIQSLQEPVSYNNKVVRDDIARWCHVTDPSDLPRVFARYTTLSMLHRLTPPRVFLNTFRACIRFGDFLGAYILFNTFQYQIEIYSSESNTRTVLLPRDHYINETRKDSSNMMKELLVLLEGRQDFNFRYNMPDEGAYIRLANELIKKESDGQKEVLFFETADSRENNTVLVWKYPRRVDFLEFFYRVFPDFEREFKDKHFDHSDLIYMTQDLECAKWILDKGGWTDYNIEAAVSGILYKPASDVYQLLGHVDSQDQHPFKLELARFVNRRGMDSLLMKWIDGEVPYIRKIPAIAEIFKRRDAPDQNHGAGKILWDILKQLIYYSDTISKKVFCGAFEIVAKTILGVIPATTRLNMHDRRRAIGDILYALDVVVTENPKFWSAHNRGDSAATVLRCIEILVDILTVLVDEEEEEEGGGGEEEEKKYTWKVVPLMKQILDILDIYAWKGTPTDEWMIFKALRRFKWEDLNRTSALEICLQAVESRQEYMENVVTPEIAMTFSDLLDLDDFDIILKRTFGKKSMGFVDAWAKVTKKTKLPVSGDYQLEQAFQSSPISSFTSYVKILLASMTEPEPQTQIQLFFANAFKKPTKGMLHPVDRLLINIFAVDVVIIRFGDELPNSNPPSMWADPDRLRYLYTKVHNILPEWARSQPALVYTKLSILFKEAGIRACDSLFGNLLFCLSILTLDPKTILKTWKEVTSESSVFGEPLFQRLFYQGLHTICFNLIVSGATNNMTEFRKMSGKNSPDTSSEIEQNIEKRRPMFNAMFRIYKGMDADPKRTYVEAVNCHLEARQILLRAVLLQDYHLSKRLIRDYLIKFEAKESLLNPFILKMGGTRFLRFAEARLPDVKKLLPGFFTGWLPKFVLGDLADLRDFGLRKNYITQTQWRNFVIEGFVAEINTFSDHTRTNLVDRFEMFISNLSVVSTSEVDLYLDTERFVIRLEDEEKSKTNTQTRRMRRVDAISIFEYCSKIQGCGPIVWYWNEILRKVFRGGRSTHDLLSYSMKMMDISLVMHVVGLRGLRGLAPEMEILLALEQEPSFIRDPWREKLETLAPKVFHRLEFVQALRMSDLKLARDQILKGALLDQDEISPMVNAYFKSATPDVEKAILRLEAVLRTKTRADAGLFMHGPLLSKRKVEKD